METAFLELMPSTLVPKVTLTQELIVPSTSATLSVMDTEHEKKAFAARLNEICYDMQIPPKGMARQTTVAGIFDVTQKGARKWLEGEGYPSIDKMREIAVWANINFEWLVSGRGPKRHGDLVAAEPHAPYDIEARVKKDAETLADEAHEIASAWIKLEPWRRAKVKADLLGAATAKQEAPPQFDAEAVRAAVLATWQAIPKTLDGAPMLHEGETFTDFVMQQLMPPDEKTDETPKVPDDEKKDTK